MIFVFKNNNKLGKVKLTERQKIKKRPLLSKTSFLYGSGGRDRTYDQLINSQLLYR